MTRNRALSLIEVVLAIVILALAVPPLMIQLNTAVRAQVSTMHQMMSVQLASERVGEVQAACIDIGRGYTYVDAANYPLENDAAGFSGFTRQTEVREVSTADYTTQETDSGVKRIRITVSDPEGNSLVTETFVCQQIATDTTPDPDGDDDTDPDDGNNGGFWWDWFGWWWWWWWR